MTLIVESGGPCPRCGGKMEFKETVGSLKTGSPVHFFQCKDCGYVHTVGDTTGSISAVPKADTSASYPHPICPTCDVPMWLIEVGYSSETEGRRIYQCKVCNMKLFVPFAVTPKFPVHKPLA